MECDHCGKETDNGMFKLYSVDGKNSTSFYLCDNCREVIFSFIHGMGNVTSKQMFEEKAKILLPLKDIDSFSKNTGEIITNINIQFLNVSQEGKPKSRPGKIDITYSKIQ